MVDQISSPSQASFLGALSSDRLSQEKAKDNQDLGQAEFMSLMTTQLKNQNPVSPMDNNEFVAQMAQFSMVNGIAEMQQSFNNLSLSLQSNRALEASVLVGRDVYVAGDAMALESGQSLGGAVELKEAVDDVLIRISNDRGELVKTVNLGPQSSRFAKFEWDGLDENGDKTPAGQYRFDAQARTGISSTVLETTIRARVESVNLRSGSEMKLNLAGLGAHTMASIVEIGVAS